MTDKIKQIEAGKQTSVEKKLTSEEVKKIVLDIAKVDGDLEMNLRQLGDEILPKAFSKDAKEKKESHEKLETKAMEVLTALETETHVALMESFNPQYRGLARELSEQIIKEHVCTTATEKILVETIVNAYIRTIDTSRRFNNNCGGPGLPITETKTRYLAMLGKQIDRSNRQFLSALMTLKQLKAPTIEMNIKAHTAFVSQNQQVNVEKHGSENNEPK
jgi:hypothetical protein